MCLMRNARIAALRAVFEPASGRLTIHAPGGASIVDQPLQAEGRLRIAAFLTAYLGEEARGVPRFHCVPGTVFGDQRMPVVSLINLASLADFESKVGAKRDLMRFRANVYYTGPGVERIRLGRAGHHARERPAAGDDPHGALPRDRG